MSRAAAGRREGIAAVAVIWGVTAVCTTPDVAEQEPDVAPTSAPTARAVGPLWWPGAPFDPAARDRAVWRGVEALIVMGDDPSFFTENAGDLLWCLRSIGQTAADPGLRELATNAGRRLAERWWATRPWLSPAASAYATGELLLTLGIAEELGVTDEPLRAELVERAGRFPDARLLGFDARRPPPRRGEPRYVDLDVYYDALLTAYFGERMGVRLGGNLAEVLVWLPQLWPYPGAEELGEERYRDLVYLVTHLIYTQNGYGARALDPLDHAEELVFLRDALAPVLAVEDLETAAELVDTLRSFGAWPGDDPPLAQIVVDLFDSQGEDGSWSRPEDGAYDRYHFTWTAVDALRDYRAIGP